MVTIRCRPGYFQLTITASYHTFVLTIARSAIEYGLKQSKNELGWADFRVTYPQIEKWWEIICSAYLLVSLHSEQLLKLPPQSQSEFVSHPQWDHGNGWKNILNNLRQGNSTVYLI